jgi:ribonucleoside-triphosphate reductase
VSDQEKCGAPVEVYSRVCGFFRPVQQWNKGKREEFRERKEYRLDSHRDAEAAEK